MTRKEAHAVLIRVAAALLDSRELPSEFHEDHKQKSYAAGRIAKDAERWREINKRRAGEIKMAADVLLKGEGA